MRSTIVDRDLETDDGKSDQATLGERASKSLLDGRNVFRGNRAASNLVDELEFLVALVIRLDRHNTARDLAVLTRPAGLLLVRVRELDRLRDRFPISHLGLAGLDLTGVLTLHALDVDLEMEFTHSGDDRLIALLIDL